MFSFLTSQLLNKLLGAAFIALLIGSGITLFQKNARINHLRGEVTQVVRERDDARTRLTVARVNEANLEAAVADQNAKIDILAREGDARQKILDGLREDVKAKQRVTSILGRKGESCEDADKLVMELTR